MNSQTGCPIRAQAALWVCFASLSHMASSDAGVLRQWYHWSHSVADKSMSGSMVLPQLASILMPTNNGVVLPKTTWKPATI